MSRFQTLSLKASNSAVEFLLSYYIPHVRRSMRDGDVTLRAREYFREAKRRTKTISSIKSEGVW